MLSAMCSVEPIPDRFSHRPGVALPSFDVAQHRFDGAGKGRGVPRRDQLRGGKDLGNAPGSGGNEWERRRCRLEDDIGHRFKSGGNDHYSAAVPNGESRSRAHESNMPIQAKTPAKRFKLAALSAIAHNHRRNRSCYGNDGHGAQHDVHAFRSSELTDEKKIGSVAARGDRPEVGFPQAVVHDAKGPSTEPDLFLISIFLPLTDEDEAR